MVARLMIGLAAIHPKVTCDEMKNPQDSKQSAYLQKAGAPDER
jgi:hypothetical protein